MGFLDKWRANKSVREFAKSDLGIALTQHNTEYFYGDIQSLSQLNESTKKEMINGMVVSLQSIYAAENPFLKMREVLTECIISSAELTVLSLKEEHKSQMWYADDPRISGELHQHIRQLWEHNDQLKEMNWTFGNKSTDEELIAYCNVQGAVCVYLTNAMNYVRTIGFDDIVKSKDWLRPFELSMMIWSEDQFRSKIGLPSLLGDSMDGFKHSTFMNLVVNGHKNPYYEWENEWEQHEHS